MHPNQSTLKPNPLLSMIAGIVAITLLVSLTAPSIKYFFAPKLYTEVIIEAGSQIPDADCFLVKGEKANIYYAENMDIPTNTIGQYTVDLICNGDHYTALLRVIDTHSPDGKTQNLTLYNPTSIRPEDFLTEIHDATAVTARFITPPDLSAEKPQIVSIQLIDEGGNTTTLAAEFTVITDAEAPVIEGIQDIITYQSDTVSYRSGITVSDNLDPAPKLQIDNTGVDLSSPGEYTVIYTATDSAGNATEASATVFVYEKQEDHVPLEVIYESIDGLLSEIITDDMTDREKVEAVFWWIRLHTNYVNHSDKSDWIQAAYKMYTTRHGDCFSYFALNKLMLDRLGIPNIDVVKIPNWANDGHHYWSLVSIDGGINYYHVDITPRADVTYLLLVTDEFLDRYSKANYNSHNRDVSLYPKTPETAP